MLAGKSRSNKKLYDVLKLLPQILNACGEHAAWLIMRARRASVAQWIERPPPKRQVAGSIPAGGTSAWRCVPAGAAITGNAMKVSGQIEFEIIEQSPERVVGRMPVQPGILNPFGTAHAGATLWFADVCATVLAFGGTQMNPGQNGFPLAINLNAALLGNQKGGTFTATALYVKRGRSLSVVRTTVTGDDGRLIADVTTSHVPAK